MPCCEAVRAAGNLSSMTSLLNEPYRLESLPLDTPDDDPRWARFLDAIRSPLLAARASEAGLSLFRDHRRAGRARLRMVTTEGPGLDGRQIVAGFNCSDRVVNTGAAEMGVLAIETIGVRASHRRRGLLTALMVEALGEARERGLPLAALSASEAGIYGRFGFAPADSWRHVDVETRRVEFRPDADVASGTLEIVDPASVKDEIVKLFAAHRSRHRGSVSPGHGDVMVISGQWDASAQGPSTTLRHLAHFDAAGTLDGLATFTPRQLDDPPVTAEVGTVLAADPAVERALWRGLAGIDLIDVLSYDQPNADDSLDWSLVDRRAVKVTRSHDHMWLRILDLPTAAAGRSFAGAGAITLTVDDKLGFCAGSWLLEVADGRAVCTRAEPDDPAAPEVRVGVDTLAGLWLGGTAPSTLIDAGRVSGDDEALGVFSTLFATTGQPRNLSWF